MRVGAGVDLELPESMPVWLWHPVAGLAILANVTEVSNVQKSIIFCVRSLAQTIEVQNIVGSVASLAM